MGSPLAAEETESSTALLTETQSPCLFSPADSCTTGPGRTTPTQRWVTGKRGGVGAPGAPGLTAFRQHALFHLLQLLIAVPEFGQRLEHPLAGPHALPAGHAAVTPLRPRGQQAGDGI